MKSLPDRLQALRAALSLNWRELAARLHISEVMIHYIRSGTRNPSPRTMRRVMDLERQIQENVTSPKQPPLLRDGPAACGDGIQRLEDQAPEIPTPGPELIAFIRALEQTLNELKRRFGIK